LPDFDIVVAGGGPAGIAAAIAATRHRARVLLLERGHYPRQKVCGEFISAESLELLKWLLAARPEALDALEQAPRIERARVFAGEQQFEARIVPPAASLARYDLDALLWQAAKAAGVDAQQGVEVQRIEIHDDHGETLRTARPRVFLADGKVVDAAAVILAAGRSSRVAPVALSGEKWIGLKAHFRVPHHAMPRSTDLYCFPGGYCGVQPVRCGAEALVNACALVRPDRARTMEQVFASDPRLREASHRWEQACDTVSTGAIAFHPPETERNGAFLVGDAAGFIDPFVGDGIAMALRGGNLAGEIAASVAHGEATLRDAHRVYARRYHASFDGAFRNARRLRRLLEWPRVPRAALMAMLKIPGAAEMVVRATRSKALPNCGTAELPSW
jgi:flavin-dependent dehydrogenase